MIFDNIVGILHHKEVYNGSRLDLAYVTPQIIALSMPVDTFIQSLYRMSTSKLVNFLNEKHGSSWHIWNLQEHHEVRYDVNNIGNTGNNVTHIPTPDHKPLPLKTLIRTAEDIITFTASNSSHIALIHCKCGKGRTGSVITAYLMLRFGMTYEQANREFTQKRIQFKIVNGISIKSQQIYLHYLERWMAEGRDPALLEPMTIQILKVVVRNPCVDFYDLSLKPLDSSTNILGQSEVGDPALLLSSSIHSFETASSFKNEDCDLPRSQTEWKLTITNDQMHVLTPIDSKFQYPTDIWFNFVGYKQFANYKFPVAMAASSANVVFDLDAPLPSTKPVVCGDSVGKQIPAGCFMRTWNDTDGFMGLPIRGMKGFDSIEIFWKRVDRDHESTSPMSVPRPPSIRTVSKNMHMS